MIVIAGHDEGTNFFLTQVDIASWNQRLFLINFLSSREPLVTREVGTAVTSYSSAWLAIKNEYGDFNREVVDASSPASL